MNQFISIPDHENLVFQHTLNTQAVTSDVAGLVDYVKNRFSKLNHANVLDLGTGTGIIPFMLRLSFPDWNFTGIEIQEPLYLTACENVKRNHIQNITFINNNITAIEDYLTETYDLVIANPPYYRQDQGIISTCKEKAIARHEITANMHDFIKAARYSLKANGTALILYPVFRENELMQTTDKLSLKITDKHPLPGNNPKNQKFIYELKYA